MPVSPNVYRNNGDSFAILDVLRSLGDDWELFVTLREIYLEDAPQLIGEIGECIQVSDSQGLRFAAHKLKGLVANFIVGDFVAALQKLENAADAGELSLAAGLLSTIIERNQWLTSTLANASPVA